MHEFVEAFKFIGRNGAVPGEPNLPSLAHLALETLKVGAIGVAISLVIALPIAMTYTSGRDDRNQSLVYGIVGLFMAGLTIRALTTS